MITVSPKTLSWSEPPIWAQPPENETILLVMRHGETFGNKSSDETTYTYTGCLTDFTLNSEGQKQAERVADKIAVLATTGKLKISAIYTSPLLRTIETVSPISKIFGLPLQQRIDLREINWGDAEGKLVKEIDVDQGWGEKEEIIEKSQTLSRREKWDLLPLIPHAEKFNAVLNRANLDIEKIAEAHRGEVVLIGTHGRVIKCLTAEALDQDDNCVPYPKNAGTVVFRSVKGEALQLIELRDNQ